MDPVYFSDEYVETFGKRIAGDNFTYWIINSVKYICKEATATGFYFVRIK
jgi:hypothetical protein